MTVKVFVPHDGNNRELPPTHTHETWGALDLIHRLWQAFATNPTFTVAVIANLKNPSADFVVITNRGLGVVELKDKPGDIELAADGTWTYAARGNSARRIGGGSNQSIERLNPHSQVQNYASRIFGKLRQDLLDYTQADSRRMKTSTAVCFTHPLAYVEPLKQAYDAYRHQQPWERFQIIQPQNITEWVYAMSFEGHKRILEPDQVLGLPETRFSLMVSANIERMMTMKDPVGYLTVVEKMRKQESFPIYPGINTISRDPKDDITVPVRYRHVSRKHARILRSESGAFVEDLGSRHGTYVDGEKLKPDTLYPLTGKQHSIALCSPNENDPHACIFQYLLGYNPTLLTTHL